MNATEALESFTRLLNEANVAYMIVGSFSSNYHGIPRSTKDADIVLQFDASAWKLLSEKLPDGLTLNPQGGFEMVTATRKEIIKVAGTIFEIEVFHLSSDEFDRMRFSRKIKAELFNGMITWVATAEDVIVQKLRWLKTAARSKDYDDVINVMKRKGERLDFEYITQWCNQHETLEILAKARAEASA